MKERKDRYRAALQRGGDVAARSSKVFTVNSRYLRMTIEVDPDLQRDLTRWASLPVSALVLAGTTVLRTLAGTPSAVPRSMDGARHTEP
ncbi:hypothetical protein FBY35_0437 [Streptomyces sp. SLBN-118]|uniref:hypothetical protein n=1 Tax=Streptomyces sp. SLBN-118 TaxID=2768454 RepID=UPI00114EB9F9|nr:hypothetical protein [Streptomyces sp. SLBN-118]TQK50126.1 hypothetical protein FBY35_0437 [Streptomyces sp. SLBN-118]